MADITVQKIVDFLRNVRKVEPAVLQKFEENKINGTVVRRMEECHFTTLGLIAMGDQLALKEFCATNEENWDEEVERPRGFLNRRRKRSGNADYGGSIVAQKRAKKSTLRVEFGWKHWIGNRCVQVKKDKGVRERTFDMKRSANYQECLLKAQNIYYPNGISQHGRLVDMEKPYLANYDGFKINEEGFTVEGCRGTKSALRLYLVTKAKTQADSRPQGNSLSSDTSYATEEISHPQNSDSHVQGKSVTPATTTGTTQASFPSVELFSSPGGENSIFLSCRHDTKDTMSSLLPNGSLSLVTMGNLSTSRVPSLHQEQEDFGVYNFGSSSASEADSGWQNLSFGYLSTSTVPSLHQEQEDFGMPCFGSSSASEVDSGWQDDGNGLSCGNDLVSSRLDSIPLSFGDQDLTSSLTIDGRSPMDIQPVQQGQIGPYCNYGTSHTEDGSLTTAAYPNTMSQDCGLHHPDVVESIAPPSGPVEEQNPFVISLSEPLPGQVKSGRAEFCGVATVDLKKVDDKTFLGTVPRCLLPGIVKVYVITETGQLLGITHFEYFDAMAKIAKEVVGDPAKQAKLFLKLSEECKLLSDSSFQTKQQHSLQFLQLLVYTASQTGAKQFIEIIFKTSAGRIVFDSYKDRTCLPEDVARANGHDDLANYLQDLTTRFSKEPESSLKEAQIIDWSDLKAAATAAQTQGCLLEEKSSNDSSENNSDTDYFADVETSSIHSSELSRSTSEDETSEPYSREKTKASAHQSMSSIVKGAFAENGTMEKIRQNILEGVKQKSTVLIFEDSHFNSSLPGAVKGLTYTLAFQLATGSKNIPRHLHTANERFLASRENIIRQPTISFCKLHPDPDVLIESSLVKNNNDHILWIDASKQSNQLNEDILAELCTQMPIEKAIKVEWKSSDISVIQFGAHTHGDLWVLTSAFQPTRKTLFVYLADRRDALPPSYFFEDEDCESQIRCWKWKRSGNNSIQFTQALKAGKPRPGDIFPASGRVKGEYIFCISLTEPLSEDVSSGMAEFHGVATVPVHKLNPFTLSGSVPSSDQSGYVPVTVITQSGQCLCMTRFQYVDEMHEVAQQLVHNPAKRGSWFEMLLEKYGPIGTDSHLVQMLDPLNTEYQGITEAWLETISNDTDSVSSGYISIPELCGDQNPNSSLQYMYVSSSQSPSSTSPQPSHSPQPPAYPQNIPASYSPTSTLANRNSSISPISNSPYDNGMYMSQLPIIPSTTEYPGDCGFEISFGPLTESASKSAAWTYSDVSKKLYVNLASFCPFKFKTRMQPPSGTVLRAVAVFKGSTNLHDVVKRCPNHMEFSKDGSAPKDQFICSNNPAAHYHICPESMRHSVMLPYNGPRVGTEFVTEMFAFMCFSSCASGPSRRPVEVIFTLEKDGQTLGRRVVEIRVCACPGRDRNSDEKAVCGKPTSSQGVSQHAWRGSGNKGPGAKRRRTSSRTSSEEEYHVTTRNRYVCELLMNFKENLEDKFECFNLQNLDNLLVLSTSEDETEQPSSSSGIPGSVFKRGGLSTVVLSTSEDETEQPSSSSGIPGSVFKRGGFSTVQGNASPCYQ